MDVLLVPRLDMVEKEGFDILLFFLEAEDGVNHSPDSYLDRM